MSSPRRDPDIILGTWLADGPSSMPEALRLAIARDARAASQRQVTWGAPAAPFVRSLRQLPTTRRLLLVAATIGVLLALILGTIMVGGIGPDPLHGLVRSTAAPNDQAEGTYQAVLVRVDDPPDGDVAAIDVVAVRADGRERTIGRVAGAMLPAAARDFVAGMFVSPSGWLAFRASGPSTHGWAFADLRALDRPVRYVEIPWWGVAPSRADGAWGPDGRFVGSASEYHDTYQAIDPQTGAFTVVPGADAYRVVAAMREPGRSGGAASAVVYAGGAVWATAGVDGSSIVLSQTTGPRRIRPDGTVLDVCHVNGPPCARPDVHDGALTTTDASGGVSTRVVDALLPDRVVDASYAADPSTIWLVLRPMADASRPILARSEPDGRVSVIRDFMPQSDALQAPSICCGWSSFAGIAPDDSLVALDAPALPGPVIMATTAAGAQPWAHAGRFAGFLSSTVADALPGGDWVAPPDYLGDARSTTGTRPSSSASDGPAAPSPAPAEPSEGFQLVRTEVHDGTGRPGGSHVVTELGPFDAPHGLAVFLTCVGPSEARLTTDLPGDEPWPNPCYGATIGGERPVPLSGAPVTVKVTADPATTWQVSVFTGLSAP